MPASTFALPRELRDLIYEYHLSATYQNRLLKPPEFQTSPPTSKTLHLGTVQQPQYGRLEILLVSKTVHEEAMLILYKCGLFFFNVPTAITPLQMGRLNTANLQNVIIHLDLIIALTAYNGLETTKCITHSAAAMIKHFAKLDKTLPQTTCTVQIGCNFESDFISGELEELIDAIGELTRFSTVTVKLSFQTDWDRSWYHGWLKAALGELGRKQAITSDDGLWYCWRYHPRDG